ncbi:ribonuclease HII [Oleiagrimonas sp. C23AA]|uniref:ribonuclease HII n=1 Tax=Oleiagrimonas sp. C23AA TaxID=2719047 RepID=UPI001F0F88B1|nr:ribonuclease HII [Oleiagrimonas sp. C23AA]
MPCVSDTLDPDWRVAGVDEAGRGPLAGPVVVAAVILDPARPIAGLDDSKKLTERVRNTLFPQIQERALAWSIVEMHRDEIDHLNIFQATMTGMCRALEGLALTPDYALVDGNRLPKALPCPGQAVIGGDGSEACIGAASILAKVHRDRYMVDLHQRFPDYGFARHKGYPVPEHLDVLRRIGPCDEHRRSFAPVRERLQADLIGSAL